MATTIINPSPSSDSSGNNGMGFIIGGVVLVVLAILFFVYALPLIRNVGGGEGIQVNLPKTVDVTVQQAE
jgi:hypothetical protein